MKYRNDLKKRVLAGLFAGAALCLAAPAALAASSPVANNQLPVGGNVAAGTVDLGILEQGKNPNGATSATITQNSVNAVITWDSFNIGANATVNFEKGANYQGGDARFNTLNYDKSNSMSQIYGTINAQGGNIYIVNPAGVEIGNSAQINVGSLYVSNKYLNENEFAGFNGSNLSDLYDASQTSDAVLMSLGNINATNVTFEGNRIVIDTERLKDASGDNKLDAENIIVRTNDASNVVIGYDAYNKENKTYEGANNTDTIATVNNNVITKADGYMWVEDVEQLQAIGASADTLKGNYALRNSIDATATQDTNFTSIGDETNHFNGRFDGLDYNIFNLNIDHGTEENVGLFGVVGDNAVISNVTLVGGSITGGANVGALAGSVQGGAHISNITNSASVTGATNVGGIAGYVGNGANPTETVLENLVNTGSISGETVNIGGLIGNVYYGELKGNSYNLGNVSSEGSNVGGLVGHAYHSTLGVGTNLIYNRLNVTGDHNVGGIVGNMEGSTVQNAENSGNVTATGYNEKGTYSYHTAHYDEADDDVENGIKTLENVYIANAGGIAGSASGSSTITDVLNTGDVSSSTAEENSYTYYMAGNVGGIVGSAVDTNITDATNQENEIRGAHNVGGIAGYFSGEGTLEKGVNDGGDIMATGARNDSGFVTEWVRAGGTGDENTIIGNMGGVVGYMYGDGVSITASANRGTVHSQDITGTEVLPTSQAANAGGIVGKIDRNETLTTEKDQTWADVLGSGYANAAVSNSYNTGDVRGYMGVGGVAGMMYNGEIAGSYNLGTVNTTRNAESFGQGSHYNTVNMGGIVGDTTEGTDALALLYDVYNKGQIGDEKFQYYARHVGGIAGRLSGTVEKAYNTGAIYNGYNVVGGIAGWMYKGSIKNAFNTGNITVVNNEIENASSQVGGIVGAVSTNVGNPITNAGVTITNVYNLGTLRSFRGNTEGQNTVGGIIGIINGAGRHQVSITNAYTTGNIWAGIKDNGEDTYSEDTSGTIQSIWGASEVSADGAHRSVAVENTYYIQPAGGLPFTDLANPVNDRDNSNKTIAFTDKDDISQYTFSGGITNPAGGDSKGENVDDEHSEWRIYEGSTPILNAFLPNAEKYFSDTVNHPDAMNGVGSIQYGTAYDPLLTIVNAADGTTNLTFDWQDLGINNDAGLAVYGAGLTVDNFMSTGGSGYFGGLIYSDGALTIKADTDGENPHSITGDVALGSASQLYGSSVTIEADGQVTIYGSVTATGNVQDGTSWNETTHEYTEDLNGQTSGNISITGGSVDIYGQLTSASKTEDKEDKEDKGVFVPGINGMASGWEPGTVSDPHASMSDIGDRFGYTTGASDVTGNISITAKDTSDGHVNVYYGNKGEGLVTTAGDLTVTASGDIYMDSDLSIGGNLSLAAGDDSEAVLDISNIGKVQAEKGTITDALVGLHNFLDQFSQQGENVPSITLDGGETKLAVDMWDEEHHTFDLTKYDNGDDTLLSHLNNLNLTVNDTSMEGAKDCTYIWVSTGEQLAGIQQYYEQETEAGRPTGILSYNFALKNDIDASDVTDYEAIGTGAENGYTGTFDGRGNRIIGLDTTKQTDGKTLTNAGIFDTIGRVENEDGTVKQMGTVEDLRVYAGTFTGTNNAGAVAGVNKGNISNVTAFGNVVDVQNTANEVSYAGGIVGTNEGSITGASAVGTATQSSIVTAGSQEAAAGGIAGLNKTNGTISNSSANSAVNASAGNATALGGVTGVNEGRLNNVDSLGVTTGIYKGEDTKYSDNVGGIAGTNSGTVTNVYNESIVSGRDNVGGILGTNKGTGVTNVANASSITGEAGANDISEHVGGLVGANEGSITNGRNNGEITGNNYVGGLVGANGKDSTLTNLVNDESAAIIGDNYVGGIAGSNEGTISAANQDNLINRGTITGQMYVGGVAGENIGTIEYVKNDIDLIVRNPSEAAMYFGGVAGINGRVDESGNVIKDDKGNVLYKGTITSATNQANIVAPEADYVGGIVGWNTAAGVLQGMGNSNEGRVEGASHVGGVAGKNDAAITGSLNDMVGIENSGVVIAHEGGAGGIFGENTGKIEYAEITNNGIVSGTASDDESKNGTGGIFGVNSGDVTYSSLKNEIGGQVMGTQNVGGLIGVNSGTITGGRTEKDDKDVGYYKYQIYNNGTIMAGKWEDMNKDGKVDEKELTPADGNSQNIGGLIGSNVKDGEKTGSLTAGYNTGAIIADSSTNVGGIAGTNAGTLDQVFNTVMNADGTAGSITGKNNVGGIAGSNEAGAEISNAYNTSIITNGASIAGANSGKISNVYGSGTLVGSGNSSSVSNGYNISDSSDEKYWKDQNSYSGFDFDTTNADGTESIWKIYEGSTNPLLKVFLTKVTVHHDKLPDFVADGNEHTLDVGALITNGALTAPEEVGFGAYRGNTHLIQSNGHSAMGSYDDWLYSLQIAASGAGDSFNPNLLGYDIDLALGIGLPPDVVEPPVNEHWNFLFDDDPWGRNRDFRERKANIHFIAGGMTL